jgi:Na+-translocating ferredoxin:NAD+ oxidoreductase RNF subunit RnfB
MLNVILITLGFSFLLAMILGVALGFFQQKFKVERDPLVDELRAALPGANCGGCGYPGCDGYAEAVATRVALPNRCSAGGAATAAAVAAIVGSEAKAEDLVSVLLCHGTKAKAANRGVYVGVPTCRASKLSTGSIKACAWGCQGFGDCVAVCRFDALTMGEDGLPRVNYDNCTGCGMCQAECPQRLFALVPRARVGSVVACSNRNPVKSAVIKDCKAGCIKCEACVRVCPEACISMVGGIPVTDYAKCTSCGACVDKCPTKCYIMLEGLKTATPVTA